MVMCGGQNLMDGYGRNDKELHPLSKLKKQFDIHYCIREVSVNTIHKEQVSLKLKYCKLANVVADIMTKALTGERFNKLRIMTGLLPMI